jgi:hypothetical protein
MIKMGGWSVAELTAAVGREWRKSKGKALGVCAWVSREVHAARRGAGGRNDSCGKRKYHNARKRKHGVRDARGRRIRLSVSLLL